METLAVVGVMPSVATGLADQRVDHRRLAGVELADDDQQEQLIQGARGLPQDPQVVGRGIEAGQRLAQIVEQRPLRADQGTPPLVQHLDRARDHHRCPPVPGAWRAPCQCTWWQGEAW